MRPPPPDLSRYREAQLDGLPLTEPSPPKEGQPKHKYLAPKQLRDAEIQMAWRMWRLRPGGPRRSEVKREPLYLRGISAMARHRANLIVHELMSNPAATKKSLAALLGISVGTVSRYMDWPPLLRKLDAAMTERMALAINAAFAHCEAVIHQEIPEDADAKAADAIGRRKDAMARWLVDRWDKHRAMARKEEPVNQPRPVSLDEALRRVKAIVADVEPVRERVKLEF